MKTRLLTLFLITSTLLHTAARAQEQPAPEHSLTGNLGLVSDYRFRGISQSWKRPAVQAGLDHAHRSGFYLGAWGSSVSGNSYNNGSGLELDLYGGFKTTLAQDLTLDVGALAYLYPGARLNSAPGQPTGNKYDNLDLYAALSHGAFSARLSVAATDYFGLDGQTAGYAYFNPLPVKGAGKGSSKGSAYLDLNYTLDLGQGVAAGLHLGHLAVRGYGELSYTDWKVSVAREFAGLNLSAALVGSNADKTWYQAGNAAGQNPRRLGNTGLVLGVSRAF